mmetsp:Transcript_17780/g.28398  ORF Transcript_17780/g.28398 Transcript_17780/m.28398 type:complete len:252 (+) Transcript_17780:559-1314(+)
MYSPPFLLILRGRYLLLVIKKLRAFKTLQRPFMIPVPFSIQPFDLSACLIVREPRGSGNEKGFRFRKKVAESKNITVITLKSLRKTHSAERFDSILKRHKVIFADKRVYRRLPKLFGDKYYRRFSPIPVELRGLDWHTECQIASQFTTLSLSRATTFPIRIGRRGMPVEALLQNALSAAGGAVRHLFPSRLWRSVQAIYVRTEDSIGLPILNKKEHEDMTILSEKYGSHAVVGKAESSSDVQQDQAQSLSG